MKRTILLVLCLGLAACGGEDGTSNENTGNNGNNSSSSSSSTSKSSQIEQINTSCPSRPGSLTGSAEEGESCSSYSDCKPVCCNCSSGGDSWAAAACINGKCAGSSAACSETSSSATCE